MVPCLLLLERGPFGTQPVLVGMKGGDGKGDITTCHFFVLRSRSRFLLVLEQGLGPVDLRVQVDVGRHRFRLKPLAIAPHPTDVGLDLVLTGSDHRLVALDLGDINVVLLLVSADLELLQHEILGDLGRLRFEIGHLIGRDGSRRHDHRCRDRGDERQAHHPRTNTGEPFALGIGDVASSSLGNLWSILRRRCNPLGR